MKISEDTIDLGECPVVVRDKQTATQAAKWIEQRILSRLGLNVVPFRRYAIRGDCRSQE